MQYLIYLLYRGALGFFGLLPLEWVYRFGWWIGRGGYVILGHYRRLSLHNLEIAFPDKSLEARRAIAREHFGRLVANLLCGLCMGGMSDDEFRRHVSFENLDELRRFRSEGRPLILALAHLSNWEIITRVYREFWPDSASATIYQPIRNPYIEAHMRGQRSRHGLTLFNRRDGFSATIAHLRQPGGVGILLDQHAGDSGIWAPFFNRLAATTNLAALLAGRTRAAIAPFAIVTTGAGRWAAVAHEFLAEIPHESIDARTVRVNEALEKMIRAHPEDWFWVHNRWKTPKPKFLLADHKRGVTLPTGMTANQLRPFRMIVRSPNWLGDAVMAIPAVRALATGRPDAEVTVLAPAKLAELWESVPEVKSVLAISAERNGVFAVSAQIRAAGPFDAAILLPNSLRSALEVRLAGVPRRVGFAGHGRRVLLDQVVKEAQDEPGPSRPHQAERYLHLARSLGAIDPPAPSVEVRARNGGFLRIGLVPGAEYGPTKRWFPERFAEAATKIAAVRPCRFVLFGVANDESIGRTIEAVLGPENCENRIGRTSLAELMSELQQCDLLLTNDTGTMHLAAWLGVPLVAIFGSTDPVATGPLSARARVLRHQVECSPCFLRDCPLDLRCLKSVAVDEVAAAALEMLPAA